MRKDAPEDLQSSDVINDITDSELKCFLLMGVGAFSASLICGDSKCSELVRNKHK